jgi:hypothetical protein
MRIECRRAGPEYLRRWLAFLGAVLLIGLLVTALHLCGVRVCLFHRLTGLPCLTCGGTRALAALAVGDVVRAFRVQPLVSALIVVCSLWLAVNTFCLAVWRRRVSVRLSPLGWFLLVTGLLALAVCNWVVLFRRGV